jgi:hypothetical protein
MSGDPTKERPGGGEPPPPSAVDERSEREANDQAARFLERHPEIDLALRLSGSLKNIHEFEDKLCSNNDDKEWMRELIRLADGLRDVLVERYLKIIEKMDIGLNRCAVKF